MNKKKVLMTFLTLSVTLFLFCGIARAYDPSDRGDERQPFLSNSAQQNDDTQTDDSTVNQTNASGRTTMTYSYKGGVLASIYNHDDNTIQHFEGGNMTRITLSSGETIYTATYENGHIVSSQDQYGDTTYYNAVGQKTNTTHTFYEHYDENGNGYNDEDCDGFDEDGNPINLAAVGDRSGPKTETIATYAYNEYGQLDYQMSKVPDESGNDVWQKMQYNYDGANLTSISVYDAEGNHLSEIEFSIDANGDELATTYTIDADNKWHVSKVTRTDAATGRKSDTYYSVGGSYTDSKGNVVGEDEALDEDGNKRDGYTKIAAGTITGYGEYDRHNRLVQTTDMNGNITKTIIYEGAMKVESISYKYDNGVAVLKNTTYYDQWGNMTHTVQDLKQPGDDDWCRYDPWTEGELALDENGALVLIVDPNDVDGNSFYNFDPRTFGNCEEEVDENGNKTGRFIVHIACQDDATFEALVEGAKEGKRVNLMWQYYASDAAGNLWLNLASPSDADMGWAVQYHSQHDDWSQVNGATAEDAGNLSQFYFLP